MSGYADKAARGGSMIGPRSLFIQKPFRAVDLAVQVKIALSSSPGDTPPARSGDKTAE